MNRDVILVNVGGLIFWIGLAAMMYAIIPFVIDIVYFLATFYMGLWGDKQLFAIFIHGLLLVFIGIACFAVGKRPE